MDDCCSGVTRLLYSCSGASDVGEIADGVARRLRREGFARLRRSLLIRREMLVLATDEVLPTHKDPVSAARDLGQVILVLRIGGRHLHWGDPAQEAEVFVR